MNTNIVKNIFRIIAPSFLNNKKWFLLAGGILTFFLVLFNVFFGTKKQEPRLFEKDNITIFLENLMIRESGLYTLLGSKPMTGFDITGTIEETEDDIRKSYDDAASFFIKCQEDSENFKWHGRPLPEYEVYRKVCVDNRHRMRFLNRQRLWNSWQQEKGTISNQVYMLMSHGKENPGGLFINIPNTIYVLRKYYADFAKITGIRFNIDTILNSIYDDESPFWEKVFNNHYLKGLLFGYGEKNSCLFEWVRENSLSLNSVSIVRFPELSRINDDHYLMQRANIAVQDLPIPYFASFEIADENVERFSREREKIINFLQDKDFIPFVLSHLNCKS